MSADPAIQPGPSHADTGIDGVLTRMRRILGPILGRLESTGTEAHDNHQTSEGNETMNTDTETTTVENGVNVAALLGAREALEAAPEAAQFTWRASCEWVNGTHSRSTVDGFFGLGTEHQRGRAFTIEADHPEVFAAEDNAPTPVEIVLSGLASCLTAGIASVAQHRGIQLNSVRATVEGDMDLYGILGIDADVRNGFRGIRISFDIDADASDEDVRALVAQSQRRSAVFDIVTNPTNVHVSVA